MKLIPWIPHIIACMLLSFTRNAGGHYWNYPSIDTSEHLSDVVLNNANVTHMRFLLIIHDRSPECPIDNLLSQRLPYVQHLAYFTHDFAFSSQYIWYKLDNDQSIANKMNLPTLDCPTVLYVPKGVDPWTEYKIWTPPEDSNQPTIDGWLWEQLSSKVELRNDHTESVTVTTISDTYRQQFKNVAVPVGDTVSVDSCISCRLIAKANGEFIGGEVIDETQKTLVVSQLVTHEPEKEWNTNVANVEKYKNGFTRQWIWNHCSRQRLNYKQPLLLPKFTETGYVKSKMPDAVFKALSGFYDNNKDRIRVEEIHHVAEASINIETRNCTIVHLSEQIKRTVSALLLPELKKWCNCELKETSFYGIREYYQGNVMRNHVDRVETHVISVILQVYQDLDNGPDWDLEVIQYNGERYNVHLKAGDMLFYESARLIHGRPRPFAGKVFANAFLHFLPEGGWNYANSQNVLYDYDNGIQERLRVLDSEFVSKRISDVRIKDEL